MENLQTILQSATPVLIDCFVTWCGGNARTSAHSFVEQLYSILI